jgi:hypothetical protein
MFEPTIVIWTPNQQALFLTPNIFPIIPLLYNALKSFESRGQIQHSFGETALR